MMQLQTVYNYILGYNRMNFVTLGHGVNRWACDRLTWRTIDWLSRLNRCQSTDWLGYTWSTCQSTSDKICASLSLYDNTRCCCAAIAGCKLRQQMHPAQFWSWCQQSESKTLKSFSCYNNLIKNLQKYVDAAEQYVRRVSGLNLAARSAIGYVTLLCVQLQV